VVEQPSAPRRPGSGHCQRSRIAPERWGAPDLPLCQRRRQVPVVPRRAAAAQFCRWPHRGRGRVAGHHTGQRKWRQPAFGCQRVCQQLWRDP